MMTIEMISATLLFIICIAILVGILAYAIYYVHKMHRLRKMSKEEIWKMVVKINETLDAFEAKHYKIGEFGNAMFAIGTECDRQNDDSMIEFIKYFGFSNILTLHAVRVAYDYEEFMHMVNGEERIL